ncbi:MAG: hypothetical protein V5783_08710 [Pontiella sp.]
MKKYIAISCFLFLVMFPAVAATNCCVEVINREFEHLEIEGRFSGKLIKIIALAVQKFEAQGFDFENYKVSVFGDDENDYIVLFVDATLSPLSGQSRKHPMFTVYITKATMKVDYCTLWSPTGVEIILEKSPDQSCPPIHKSE